MRRQSNTHACAPERLVTETVEQWARLWELPALASAVSVAFSRRLRTTLGRSTPATRRVVMNAALLDGADARLLEVLCHELAHVATYLRYGAAARPHGPEWAALVRQAGYPPATHAAVSTVRRAASAPRPQHYSVVHTCPVCQTRRFARRPVRRWRCAECVAAGLPGELTVTRTAPAQ